MMGEWKEYKLGDVCSRLSSGKNIRAEFVKDSGLYPVYGGNGLRGYTDNFNFEGECGIIGRQGAYCGNVRFFKGKGYMTEHAVVVQGNEFADTYYLSSLLSTMHLERLSGQSAQPGLAVGTLSVQNIVLPDISIQKKISSILSSLDAKIENNNKINANLEAQAQALFKSWLQKCNRIVRIGDLCENIQDYSKNTNPFVVLINSSDVTEGFFDHHIYSENKGLKGHFKKRFKKGDILYSQVRPRNRHWAYCQFDSENYLASTQLMVIRNKKDMISSSLLYQYLIWDKVWMEFTNKTETRSGTFPQGNFEEMSTIEVPYEAEMKSITILLDNIYALMYNNVIGNQRLSTLRDTLLPKLMSGEIEV